MQQMPLRPLGGDPDTYFTTDADGQEHLVIPAGLGGRYMMFARLDWTKENPYGGQGPPLWTVNNTTAGKLFAYPALAGDPTYSLPASRLTAAPVAHSRHTWQQFLWHGPLNEGDEIQFFLQQSVSDGETCEDEMGNVFDIEVQATLILDLRRPGIQY